MGQDKFAKTNGYKEMRSARVFVQVSHRTLLFLTTSLVVVVSVNLMFSAFLESFLVVSLPLPKADAIVVMAGSRDVRLPPAAKLYKEGLAPLVLLTNDGVFASWSQKYQRNLYQVEWSKENLIEIGVPDGAIDLLNYTFSGTIHDVLNTLDYVRAHPDISSLLVVTSEYHTRRTLWAFLRVFKDEKIQIGISPVPDLPQPWWQRTSVLYLEFLKYLYYQARY